MCLGVRRVNARMLARGTTGCADRSHRGGNQDGRSLTKGRIAQVAEKASKPASVVPSPVHSLLPRTTIAVMPDSTLPPPERPAGALVIRGARTHNLKGVDLTIPPRQLVVFTR